MRLPSAAAQTLTRGTLRFLSLILPSFLPQEREWCEARGHDKKEPFRQELHDVILQADLLV